MRTFYLISAAIGAALFIGGLSGCVFGGRAGGPPPEANQIQVVETVCEVAAHDTTAAAIANNPDARQKFAAGLAGFKALASRTNYSAAEFSAELAKLPAISGDRGAIYAARSGVVVFSLVLGWLDLEKPVLLEAALRGTCSGLERALKQ